ncbi:PrgI family protein [Patescibacteria group bacterium]|nr:PrgI family protein [Patescibacteria group bacterium]
MRQHPIPQNILDVEFKLFSKFTLKEFAYLAIGLGFGGLMIYLVVSKVIPGLIGVPLCILTSGAGIFLGLVPINDQDADVFIKNYVSAITAPTQRVWMNSEMQQERNKPELKPSADGKLVQKSFKEKASPIIGGNLLQTKAEEEVQPVNTPTAQATPTPTVQDSIIISEENRKSYEFTIQNLDKLPGNINIWLYTGDMISVPNVITYMKGEDGKILYANRTGVSGYFLTNRTWGKGIYTLEFIHPQFKFPKVRIIVTDETNKLPIKIKTI